MSKIKWHYMSGQQKAMSQKCLIKNGNILAANYIFTFFTKSTMDD